MLKLYHSPQTRSSRMVWLLEEIGEPYEIEYLNIRAEGGLPESYRAVHPLKKVPALQHDGIQNEVAARQSEDDAKIAKLEASTPAVRTIYADGGQNPEFAKAGLADVSRPEALAAGATDWVVEPSAAKGTSPVVKLAAKKAAARTSVAKAKAASPVLADTSDRTATIKKSQAAL